MASDPSSAAPADATPELGVGKRPKYGRAIDGIVAHASPAMSLDRCALLIRKRQPTVADGGCMPAQECAALIQVVRQAPVGRAARPTHNIFECGVWLIG